MITTILLIAGACIVAYFVFRYLFKPKGSTDALSLDTNRIYGTPTVTANKTYLNYQIPTTWEQAQKTTRKIANAPLTYGGGGQGMRGTTLV